MSTKRTGKAGIFISQNKLNHNQSNNSQESLFLIKSNSEILEGKKKGGGVCVKRP